MWGMFFLNNFLLPWLTNDRTGAIYISVSEALTSLMFEAVPCQLSKEPWFFRVEQLGEGNILTCGHENCILKVLLTWRKSSKGLRKHTGPFTSQAREENMKPPMESWVLNIRVCCKRWLKNPKVGHHSSFFPGIFGVSSFLRYHFNFVLYPFHLYATSSQLTDSIPHKDILL